MIDNPRQDAPSFCLRPIPPVALAACALIAATSLLTAPTLAAPAPKVQICHIPPGNPANWHTIEVSENAVATHLEKHGDLLGACNALCATLCDDGNACTIDDTGDCETNGCPATPVVVDCNDSNPCTADSCDPSTGCEYSNRPSDVSCVVDAPGVCDEETGLCDGAGSCIPGAVPGCCTSTDQCTEWDTNRCTIEECQNNACVKVGDVECDDMNACTADFCVKATGECNFEDVSEQCPNPDCHHNGCDPDTGCYSIRDEDCCVSDSECDDQSNCTTDSCIDHVCVSVDCAFGDDCKVLVDCDPFTCEPTFESPCTIDDDPCTTQYCSLEDGGCVTEPTCNPETETCNDGVCEPIEVSCFSASQHTDPDPSDPDPLQSLIDDCEARAGCPPGICGGLDDAPYVSVAQACLGGHQPSCDQIDQIGISYGCTNIIGTPDCPPEPEGCPPPPSAIGSCPCWDGGSQSVPGVTSLTDLWAQLGPDECPATFGGDRCTDGLFSDCTTVTIAQCNPGSGQLFKTTVRDDFIGGAPGPRCEVNGSALFPLIGSVGLTVSGLTPQDYEACLQEHDAFTLGVSIPMTPGVNTIEGCGLAQEPPQACANSADGDPCDADGIDGSCQDGECVPDDANVGDEFVLVFQYTSIFDSPGPPDLTLFISAAMATNGIVEIPGLGFSQPFSVVPGAISPVIVPSGAMISTSDVIEEGAAVHITSDNLVRIYGLNRIPVTTDAFTALPVSSLGQDYLVMAWRSQAYADSELAIAATQDDTQVTITPTVTSGARAAGVPYTITLNRFDAYQLRSPAGDLTGTRIQSTAPISVFGGSQCGLVPNNNWLYCDHLVEQMPPINMWGTEALTVPLATRSGGDSFRAMAAQDNTTIAADGPIPASITLDAGEYVDVLLDGNNRITADGPILVAQLSNGTEFDGAVADPFMMLLPTVQDFLPSYTFTTPGSGFPSNFVNIVALTTDATAGAVLLDGTPVTAASFTPMPSSPYSGAKVPVSVGTHTLEAPNPLGMAIYGYAPYDSYGYSGGFSAAP